jgi:hypothetical protein
MLGFLSALFTGAPVLAASENVLLEELALVSIETGLASISEMDADTVLQAVDDDTILKPLRQIIVQALTVAQLDMSTEEKAEALVEVTATSCSSLFYSTIYAVAINIFIDDVFFNIPGIETIINVLAGLTVICYLGLI